MEIPLTDLFKYTKWATVNKTTLLKNRDAVSLTGTFQLEGITILEKKSRLIAF